MSTNDKTPRLVKDHDLRTALQILRDEAALQGLYPSAHDRSDRDAQARPDLPGPQLTRRQRVVRRLAAEAKKDDVELRLVRETARQRWYQYDEDCRERARRPSGIRHSGPCGGRV